MIVSSTDITTTVYDIITQASQPVSCVSTPTQNNKGCYIVRTNNN